MLCESLHQVFLMLPYPLGEIRSHPDVQLTVALAGKNVDTWAASSLVLIYVVRFWDYLTVTLGEDGRVKEGLVRRSIA